jgi:hypothetical protein
MSHFVNVKSSRFRNLSALIGGIESSSWAARTVPLRRRRSAWDNALWPSPRLAIKP